MKEIKSMDRMKVIKRMDRMKEIKRMLQNERDKEDGIE